MKKLRPQRVPLTTPTIVKDLEQPSTSKNKKKIKTKGESVDQTSIEYSISIRLTKLRAQRVPLSTPSIVKDFEQPSTSRSESIEMENRRDEPNFVNRYISNRLGQIRQHGVALQSTTIVKKQPSTSKNKKIKLEKKIL